MPDHILRRPFSVYARSKQEASIDILYQLVGYGSRHMANTLVEGMEVDLIGPVGRGWQPPVDAQRVLLVGGGVGAAPLYLLCEQLLAADVEVDLILGAQTKAALATLSRYEALFGHEPLCATDDGSYGRPGFCTSLVEEALTTTSSNQAPYNYVAVCGPEPLMRIVSGMAQNHGIHCEISMERRMACGIGACLSCVVDTKDGKKRACVDGPVFSAEEVVWA